MRPLLAKGTSPRAIGISSFASVMQPDSELVEACLLPRCLHLLQHNLGDSNHFPMPSGNKLLSMQA